MSRIISKLFAESNEKDLPQGFAEQILNYDISFVLSNFTNLDALNHLVQLYMKGVEYYESQQDRKQEYFKYKLHWLMSHPNLLQDKYKKVELHYPSIQEKLLQTVETQEKVQVQQLISNLQQEKQIITKIISNDMKNQEQRINNRLRQRSTSKNERQHIPGINQGNSQLKIQNSTQKNKQILEVMPEEEQSQIYSKRISPQK